MSNFQKTAACENIPNEEREKLSRGNARAILPLSILLSNSLNMLHNITKIVSDDNNN